MKITSLLEADNDLDYSIQSAQGDNYYKLKDGRIEDEIEHTFYTHAIFISKAYLHDFRQLDEMLKHFGGFNKVRMVASNTKIAFEYWSEKSNNWAPVNKVTQGKEVRFTLPYSKDPTRDFSLMLLFNQASNNGALENWKLVGYIQSPMGGDYARENPYSDPKKKF